MQQTECRVKAFLREKHVGYEVVPHRTDYTAWETAQDTHTPGVEFAKCVVLWVDGRFAIAVLPAGHHVDLTKVAMALGATHVGLADEEELEALFPDCDVGAEPPFGNLYNLPVYVSPAMQGDEHITFNAGTHDEAIRMRFEDFVNLVEPRYVDLSREAVVAGD